LNAKHKKRPLTAGAISKAKEDDLAAAFKYSILTNGKIFLLPKKLGKNYQEFKEQMDRKQNNSGVTYNVRVYGK
jgi:hypothetical protein